MPRIKVIHGYEIPPKVEEVEVEPGISIARLLYKLGLRPDGVLVAVNGRIVNDALRETIDRDCTLEILDVLDGG